jgi:uncharacterized membrane protein
VAETWDRLLTRWTAAGVVDDDTAARIRAFETSHASASRWNWPVWLALGFGALTLAAGVLLFVSAHWENLSPLTRIALVTSLVAVFHAAAAGVAERFPAMSVALHAVGTIALGAGIYLAGQIFNLEEHWPGGLMLWALGAALAAALLKAWPQTALVGILAPAWLVSEWLVAIEHHNWSGDLEPLATGLFLLAIAYFTAARSGTTPDPHRRTLIRLGGLALPFATLFLSITAFEPRVFGPHSSEPLFGIGWIVAIGLPLILATIARRRIPWLQLGAVVWVLFFVQLEPLIGETALYVWLALGAAGLAWFGVSESRVEHINMAAALFAATVVAFYFSNVMDKLGRSASLIGLGILLLAGGWGIERMRRGLVLQVKKGFAS